MVPPFSDARICLRLLDESERERHWEFLIANESREGLVVVGEGADETQEHRSLLLSFPVDWEGIPKFERDP